MIQDSGNRREFETGAVRDIDDKKGRCDLLPLDVVSLLVNDIWAEEKSRMKPGSVPIGTILCDMYEYQKTGNIDWLIQAIEDYICEEYNCSFESAMMELSMHFKEGAKKYSEYNWMLGIPTHCYIDSATRHYLKLLRHDNDERHDRAVLWNLVCCLWTAKNLKCMEDYPIKLLSPLEKE